MQYRADVYRPRHPSFDTQEQARVKEEPRRHMVLVDRWVTEAQRSYKDPTQGLRVVPPTPLPSSTAGEDANSALPSTTDAVILEDVPAVEKPPFESWAFDSKNAYITGAHRDQPAPRGSALRGSSAQPLSRTIGTRVRITEQLERERAAMANCSPQRLLVPSREAATAAAVAAQQLYPPRRAVRHANAPARSNSGATTRSGLTSAGIAQQRGPLLRRLATTSRRSVGSQTDSTLAELTAIAEKEGAVYTTDLSICPGCNKIFRGTTTVRDAATNAVETSKCPVCKPDVHLVRLLVSAPLHGGAGGRRPPTTPRPVAPPVDVPAAARSATPNSARSRSRSPAFDSDGTRMCLQWIQ